MAPRASIASPRMNINRKFPDKYPLKLPDNCILCYDFQERDNGAAMPTVLDHSGRGYHGTILGPYTVAAPVGLARRFDGADDYIGYPAGVGAAMAGSWTFEVLFQGTVNKTTGFLSSSGKITLGGNDNGYVFYALGAAPTYFTLDTPITNANWHHVVFTLDATGGAGASTINIYVNTVMRAFQQNKNTASPAVFTTSNIGINYADGAYSQETIRCVRIYNSCKSAAEIKELYNEIGWLVGLPQK